MAYLDLTGLGYFKGKLIDPTLSVAGKAAEDKAVGDAVADFLPTDTASGAIASFPDGAENTPVKALTVDIEPIQNLNGQSSPYPPGGGKNKVVPLTATVNVNGVEATCSVASETITLTGTGNSNGGRSTHLTESVTLSAGTYFVSVTGTHSGNYCVSKSVGSALVAGEGNSFTLTEDTEVFIGVNVLNGTTYNETVKVQIESGSTATDWSPYSNICPISGFAQANVTRTGKNLLPFPYEDDRTEIVGVSVTVHDDGTITFNGTPNGSTMFFNLTTPSFSAITLEPGTYTMSNGGVTGNLLRITAVKNGAYFITTNQNTGSITFNLTESGVFNFYISTPSGTAMNNLTVKPQLELGSTATTYEPYQAQTITIDLGETRYSGTLDVVNKVLTVDKICVTFDGTENYLNNYFPIVVCSKEFDDKGAYSRGTEIISNYGMSPEIGFANNTGKTFQWRNADTIYGVSSASELKALFAQYYADGNPMTICYPLESPITVPLSAQEMTTLLGQNNIFSDAGDVDVTYRADVKLYIQKYIASMVSAQGGE